MDRNAGLALFLVAAPGVALAGCTENDLVALGDLEPTEPDIRVDPVALDFGEVRTGTAPGAGEVTISNVGDGALTLYGVEVDDPYGPAFTAGALAVGSLEPSASTSVTVQFAPVVMGTASARLRVLSDDPDSPEVPVDLAGIGLAPRVDVSPAFHDFEVVDQGTVEAVALNIANGGNADLVVSDVRIESATGEMTLDRLESTNGPLPWVILPGQDRAVRVDYSPVDANPDGSTVTVVSDDPATPNAFAEQVGTGRSFEGFSTGWYVYDDGIPYETTSNPAHVVSFHGDEDLYWYEPSGAHGLIDSADPAADFETLREYVIARAGAPIEPAGPFNYDGDSTLATFEYATFTYFLCDFWLDVSDDPSLYVISSGAVDDGIQVMVNAQILGRIRLGESGSWPLANAVAGAVNTLVVILVDDSQIDKYVRDLAFYRDGVMVVD